MSETPLPNSAEARTPTGEIRDQSPTPTTPTTPSATPTAEAPAPEARQPAESLLSETEKPPAPEGAPEKYEFKAPEGKAYDTEALAAVEPIFKELGLSQEAAQKIVDAQASRETGIYAKINDGYQAMNDKWRDEAKAEWGTKLPEVRATIGRALQGSGLPEGQIKEFADAMNLTAAGNNPAFIRMFYSLAKQLGEGTAVRGAGPSPQGQAAPGAKPASLANAMYPNLQ